MSTKPKYSKYISEWNLDQDITFLNHGSFGNTPVKILQKKWNYELLMEKEAIKFFIDLLYPKYIDNKNALSKFINADINDFFLVQNTTTGVNQILKDIPTSPGDIWLTTSQVYNACKNALLYYSELKSCTLKVVNLPFPTNGNEILHLIENCIEDRTTLALIDHITSSSGIIFPIKEMIELLHRKNIKVIVDGAHAPGMINVDIQDLNPDFYIGNCHKWMCLPKGVAFTYVKSKFQSHIFPMTISHYNDVNIGQIAEWSDQFFWDGTHDYSSFLCIRDTLEFFDDLIEGGINAVMIKNHELAWNGYKVISEIIGTSITTEEKNIGSMVTIPLGFGKAEKYDFLGKHSIQKLLFEKYKIEVPVFMIPGNDNLHFRISAQIYNHISQYEYLGQCLKEIKESF